MLASISFKPVLLVHVRGGRVIIDRRDIGFRVESAVKGCIMPLADDMVGQATKGLAADDIIDPMFDRRKASRWG
jgi:hypothetical protein